MKAINILSKLQSRGMHITTIKSPTLKSKKRCRQNARIGKDISDRGTEIGFCTVNDDDDEEWDDE